MSDSPEREMTKIDSKSIENMSKILRAIAHVKRIEILSLLHDSNQEYSDILRSSEISRTALANHLNILVEHRLIVRMERGSYSLTEDGQAFYQSIMKTYLQSEARLELERSQLIEKYMYRGKSGSDDLTVIKKLKWKPRWVSHLGAVEGSLKFLKQKISTAWIYGGTGHAFVINIAKDLCPSGPTAWRTKMLFELAPNLGYKVDGVFARKQDPEFPRLQEKAWNHAKKCIDDGIPCYGWEFEAPEFYVINGYDDVGYHYSGPGCEDGKGPKPWRNLGTSEIGILEVYSVHPTDSADPIRAIKAAFEKSIYNASNPSDIIFPKYRSGIDGYEWWITAIEEGSAIAMGHSYNAAVWAECRKFAVEFLKEARKHIGGEVKGFLEDARKQYEIVSNNLESIMKGYSFSPELEGKPLGVDERTSKTVESLKRAKNAEKEGLRLLQEIVKHLS